MKNNAIYKKMMKNFLSMTDKKNSEIRDKMDKEILTIEEVAEMFSVTKRTIYSLVNENILPGVKIGGQWRFLKKDLMKIFNNDKPIKSEKDNE